MNEEVLITIIQQALEFTDGTITRESTSEDTEGWDSLGQLGILVALDKYYNGKIAGIDEMAEADSVEKILNLLKDNSLI